MNEYIPSPFSLTPQEWRKVGKRIWTRLTSDPFDFYAAAIGFYSLLSIFPMLIVLISLLGIFLDPSFVEQHMETLLILLPKDAAELIQSQVIVLTEKSPKSLSISVIVGLLLSLFSASKGSKALVLALNLAYRENETRSFFKVQLVGIVVTLGIIGLVVVCMLTLIGLPAIAALFPIDLSWALLWGRWIALAAIFSIAISFAYRYAADRKSPTFAWVIGGASLSTCILILVSVLFSYYAEKFATFSKTYGSLTSIVLLLFWFQLSAQIVLIGAMFNAEAEREVLSHESQNKAEPS